MQGNPKFGTEMKLFCETGYNLTMRATGEVLGTQDDENEDTFFRLISAGVGLVQILSMPHQLYLCFNNEGNVYGESDADASGITFEECIQGSYKGYKSVAYPDWYLGIKKTGAPKCGKSTRYGQKAVKFLSRRIER